jgi:hypothetical protein
MYFNSRTALRTKLASSRMLSEMRLKSSCINYTLELFLLDAALLGVLVD